jgi:hypothetical protein
VEDARAPRRLAGRLAARLRRGNGGPGDPTPAPELPPTPDLVVEPLVTVVVPVYAVEQYIDECLTSILAPSYALS